MVRTPQVIDRSTTSTLLAKSHSFTLRRADRTYTLLGDSHICGSWGDLATVLITEEGVDPKTVQGQLRHATSAITMDIYTHAQGAAKRAALEKYESRLIQ